MLMRYVAALMLLLCASAHAQLGILPYSGASPVAPLANVNSGVGTNLQTPSIFTPEQPFANIMKMAANWFTQNSGGSDTGEEANLCVDKFGWPTSLTQKNTGIGTACSTASTFTKVSLFLNNSLPSPFYLAGTYDIFYPSGCTWVVGRDASGQVNIGAGHDQFTVSTPSGQGIQLILTAIGTNNCNPTSVTHSSMTTAYNATCGTTDAGAGCFNPNFLKYLASFGSLRFMDWMCTNNNGSSSVAANYGAATGAGRNTPSMAFYGSDTTQPTIACGTPIELMVSLCNAIVADCWIPMPVLIDIYPTTITLASISGTTLTVVGTCTGGMNASTPLYPGIKITGAGVTAGTVITAGSGCATTFTVNNSQTVGSETMTTVSSYVENVSAYLAANLGTKQVAYTEYGNETWNFSFAAFQGLINIGTNNTSIFCSTAVCTNNGCATNNGSQDCNRSVMGHTTSLICAKFDTAFASNTARYGCDLAAQAGNTNSLIVAHDCNVYIGDFTVSSGTYTGGSGATSVTTTASHGLSVGSKFSVGLTGTGAGLGTLNSAGTPYTATSGTTGTTLNFTAATGLTISAISGGGVGKSNCTSGAKGVAIAPYFGNTVPEALTAAGFSNGGVDIMQANVMGTCSGTTTNACVPLATGNSPLTGGTASALTLTSGSSLSGTPANGRMVGVFFNVTPNNGALITVDSTAQACLLSNDGGNVSDEAPGTGFPFTLTATSATSAGAVATCNSLSWHWRLSQPGPGAGGYLGLANSWSTNYANIIAGGGDYAGWRLDGYEAGQTFDDLGHAIPNTLYTAWNLSAGAGTAYNTYWGQWAATGGHIINHFNDISAQNGFYWGLEFSLCGDSGTCASPVWSLAKYTQTLVWIAANPCTGYSPAWVCTRR